MSFILNNLSVKLLRVVFSIYLALTLLITLIQMTDEYQRKNNEIIKSLQAVQQIFETNLTTAVWTFDNNQLQAILTGMMKIPIVVGIQISNMDKPLDWKLPFPIRLGSVKNKAGQIFNIRKTEENNFFI